MELIQTYPQKTKILLNEYILDDLSNIVISYIDEDICHICNNIKLKKNIFKLTKNSTIRICDTCISMGERYYWNFESFEKRFFVRYCTFCNQTLVKDTSYMKHIESKHHKSNVLKKKSKLVSEDSSNIFRTCKCGYIINNENDFKNFSSHFNNEYHTNIRRIFETIEQYKDIFYKIYEPNEKRRNRYIMKYYNEIVKENVLFFSIYFI